MRNYQILLPIHVNILAQYDCVKMCMVSCITFNTLVYVNYFGGQEVNASDSPVWQGFARLLQFVVDFVVAGGVVVVFLTFWS